MGKWFFYRYKWLLPWCGLLLTLSLPVTCWAGDNTDLHLDSNISKTVGENIAFIEALFKEYSISFPMVCRLIDFALVVLKLLMFKVCGIIGISKIEFFNFSGTERVKILTNLSWYIMQLLLYFAKGHQNSAF